jgi:hypothetical protein
MHGLHEVGGVLRFLYEDRDVREWKQLWRQCREWPPDAFAIAHLLLAHHAIYRAAVSTDEVPGFEDQVEGHALCELWPNHGEFGDHVRTLGAQWRTFAASRIRDPRARAPAHLAQLFSIVETEMPKLLACPRGYVGASRGQLAVLFCLVAAADEACVGLGLPGPAPTGATAFSLEAELYLVEPTHGSLARFSPHIIRVLPKAHTPQRGLTLRSLSHHVCATTHDFGVSWQIPPGNTLMSSRDERLNLLLLPWPLEISDNVVAPTVVYDTDLPEGWGYFDFAPKAAFDVDKACSIVKAATAQGFGVDGVVLPEAAVTQAEADRLLSALDSLDVKIALLGVRGDRENAAYLHARGGFEYQQGKHHRWCLDRSQIEQYGFQRTLNPLVNWWENIRLAPRTLGFLAASSWLTLCHVICEDLARLDPVDQLIRSVGPNLLIALLQDGPQLRQRWGARYAAVYSEDPGTSVLTLTSLGMALASRPPPGAPSRRCVALWSDPDNGTKELDLEPGASALWLSLCVRRVTEYTADGRSDGGMASRLVLVDHRSIQR